MMLPGKHALEEHWLIRLQHAQLLVSSARARATALVHVANEIPVPDSSYAYQQALRAEMAALTEYRRVLRIFAELVVEGKMPNEGE